MSEYLTKSTPLTNYQFINQNKKQQSITDQIRKLKAIYSREILAR